MNWSKERWGGMVMLVLCISYGWEASNIAQLPIDQFEAMTARSLPYTLAIVGSLLSIVLIVRSGETPSAAAAAAMNAEGSQTSSWRNRATVAALLGWTAIYGLLLDYLGFLLASCLFLSIGFVGLGERRWWVAGGLAALTAGLFYVILRFGLGVYMAPGTLWASGWLGAWPSELFEHSVVFLSMRGQDCV